MRFNFSRQHGGAALLTMLTLLTLWLAVQGKLTLYIHPRYIWFTVILCAAGLVTMLTAEIMSRLERHHDDALSEAPTTISAVVLGFCLVFCAVLAVTKPMGLTSSAAQQRVINSASLDITTASIDLSDASTDYSQFNVKEWASLLSQTTDSSQLAGKKAQITGFVSETPDKNSDVFYASRFIVTCCAIDARPVGVAVYSKEWARQFTPDEWVRVEGTFIESPSGDPAIVLEPTAIQRIDEPKEPYVY